MDSRNRSLLAISIASTWLMMPVLADAEEAAKAPCEAIARQLRDIADRESDPIVDTGDWEFLTAAGFRDPTLAPTGPASKIDRQQFNTVDAALQSLSGIELGAAPKQLVDEFGFSDITPTYIHDFRPASDHLIIFQSQGTLNCDTGVMYRIASGRLEPTGTISDKPGDMCGTEHLTAFRVGATAYAAVESITDEPGALRYDLSLMPPEPAVITADAAACRIAITFAPTTYLRAAGPAHGVTDAWVGSLLAKIGPLLTDNQDPGAALQPMTPKPDGNTAYDDFLRSSPDEAPHFLRSLDPNNLLDELPENEDGANFGSTSGMTAYALAFEGHRLILKFGQGYYGSQRFPNNAFGIWEWMGNTLIPIASGDLAKHASHPEITVN